jgi:uncharacterized protein
MTVYIIHGWGATPKSDWFPYLKEELTNKGYVVKVPLMPDTDNPKIKPWVEKLKSFKVNSKTIFVGHSVGCQTILRFLENYPGKINKVILVAPWITINKDNLDENEEWSVARPWAETPIDFKKIKDKAKEFVVIYSEDDPFAIKKDIKKLITDLDAKELNIGKKGHICQDDGITTLPETLKFFKKVKKE